MQMTLTNRWLTAAVLLLAGMYQLTPQKDACLRQCRHPAQFLSRHYRPGWTGALRMGVLHGSYCVGCCWLLMALLFVGGVMNLRSEEHTSELQSLMRISYAVFCLKKKTKNIEDNENEHGRRLLRIKHNKCIK